MTDVEPAADPDPAVPDPAASMSTAAPNEEIPHEHRAKLSNMVVGKAKEIVGALTHDTELEEQGRIQEEVAERGTEPDI